jgi:SPRY domain-containing SOCS box protein 1/4
MFFLLLILAEPQPLMELCRRSIRKSMGKQRLLKVQDNVEKLPLPGCLKRYIQYQW